MADTPSTPRPATEPRVTTHIPLVSSRPGRWRRLVAWLRRGGHRLVTTGGPALGAVVLFVQPVVAQSAASFCETALAQTITNLFQVIQLGGPLVGGLVALGATVALSVVRRADLKREIKQVRNQGLLWGVIVAPLGTTIINFLLGTIVAGGQSCRF